mmetsp:Transcript_9062/g.21822  ORF Transcript_9062/g.21822 Transcript_9062/m.21822 type:complete len:84 (+) Transcript_9062:145-396(+)
MPLPDEIILPKTSCNVFVSTNLDYILRCLGICSLVVCGCRKPMTLVFSRTCVLHSCFSFLFFFPYISCPLTTFSLAVGLFLLQ